MVCKNIPLAAAVSLAIAAGSAGCGEEERTARADGAALASNAESPEQRAVRAKAEEFLAVMHARDDASACSLMTRKLRAGIDFNLERRALRGSCRTRAAHVFSSAKAPGHAGARVKSVVVAGTGATATATAPGGIESEIQLQRVGRRWWIADF